MNEFNSVKACTRSSIRLNISDPRKYLQPYWEERGSAVLCLPCWVIYPREKRLCWRDAFVFLPSPDILVANLYSKERSWALLLLEKQLVRVLLAAGAVMSNAQ